MELKIVNKEIASNLKELGFYLDTNGNFRNIDNLKEGRVIINPDLQDPKEFYFNNKKAILIPTQSLVVKWLRDIYNIRVSLIPIYDNKANYLRGWDVEVNEICLNNNDCYTTYEQAEEAGIIEALKLIKN